MPAQPIAAPPTYTGCLPWFPLLTTTNSSKKYFVESLVVLLCVDTTRHEDGFICWPALARLEECGLYFFLFRGIRRLALAPAMAESLRSDNPDGHIWQSFQTQRETRRGWIAALSQPARLPVCCIILSNTGCIVLSDTGSHQAYVSYVRTWYLVPLFHRTYRMSYRVSQHTQRPRWFFVLERYSGVQAMWSQNYGTGSYVVDSSSTMPQCRCCAGLWSCMWFTWRFDEVPTII